MPVPKHDDMKSAFLFKEGDKDLRAGWRWRPSRENVPRARTAMGLCLGTWTNAPVPRVVGGNLRAVWGILQRREDFSLHLRRQQTS